MSSSPRKRGLGRGLDALFLDSDAERDYERNDGGGESQNRQNRLPIGALKPGQYQPRRRFEAEAIAQLAESIGQHGIIQPLLVRPIGEGEYEIIAGERRWRAAQKAQLHEVPVIIENFSDDVALEIALIENLQREDLTAIEEAEGFQRLIAEFDYTQDALSKKLGKSRSHVTNTLRLLKLSDKIQSYVQEGRLSAGHARAVLSAKEPEILAQKVMKDGLSVRETEKLALTQGTGHGNDDQSARARAATPVKDVDTVALEKELSVQLGMRARIDPAANGSGRVTIDYKSLDQLDLLLEKLAG